ncbi:hypothetical protein RFI_10208 [Reticulomyxa filosa]|uniref:Uncharacterized protein n=1 Tax=Reticulomyxa filosa TaxID=46433 RepID=X6NLS2_RETFI|nr:hypothetical protein RFI_10208 [Reticulomyxa filosa]|eukprot:ETO26926.1 hypothetical protein RFI_10208 [Reticulomyxa filosa]
MLVSCCTYTSVPPNLAPFYTIGKTIKKYSKDYSEIAKDLQRRLEKEQKGEKEKAQTQSAPAPLVGSMSLQNLPLQKTGQIHTANLSSWTGAAPSSSLSQLANDTGTDMPWAGTDLNAHRHVTTQTNTQIQGQTHNAQQATQSLTTDNKHLPNASVSEINEQHNYVNSVTQAKLKKMPDYLHKHQMVEVDHWYMSNQKKKFEHEKVTLEEPVPQFQSILQYLGIKELTSISEGFYNYVSEPSGDMLRELRKMSFRLDQTFEEEDT